MSLIHPNTIVGTKSELDLFSLPITQTVINDTSIVEYRTSSTVTDRGPYEFILPAEGGSYTNTAEIEVYVKAKITQENGDNLPPNAPVAPANNFIHSLFSQIDVSLNKTKVSCSTTNYAYKAYQEKLLNHDINSMKSQLRCPLFIRDTAGQMNNITPQEIGAGAYNTGLRKRYNISALSREFEMIDRLHIDIGTSDKLLLNSVEMVIKMYRNSDAFCLMSANDARFKVHIIDISISVPRVTVAPPVQLAHFKVLESNKNAMYHVTRNRTKTLTLLPGKRSHTIDNIFHEFIPRRVTFAMIGDGNHVGTRDLNPFDFQHYGLKEFKVYIDNKILSPTPLKFDFQNQNYIRAYSALFSGVNRRYKDTGLSITYEDFANGYFCIPIDTSPDFSSSDNHLSLIKEGNFKIELDFVNPLANAVTLLLFYESDDLIEITKNREVKADF